MSDATRQRISVPAADIVVQPASEEVKGYSEPHLGEQVTEVPWLAAGHEPGVRRFEVVVDGWRFEVRAESASRAELRDRARRAAEEHSVASDVTLRAQIPGRIARVWVAEGERVEEGQRLLAIEAMKMENELRAPITGVVRNLRVAPGARIERDAELLTVAHNSPVDSS